jgi:hypothetical protein
LPPPAPEQPAEANSEQVHQFCGACHAYPPPDIVPRSGWRFEVERGYHFFESPTPANLQLRRSLKIPSKERVIQYYENRAPDALALLRNETPATPAPVRFQVKPWPSPPDLRFPAIANVNLVHLSDPRKLDLLACDMRSGKLLAMKPYEPEPTWRVLGQVGHPAHAEVVDLDGDGIKDILVADLGNFKPTDGPVGRIIWLRGRADGGFTPFCLLEGVGRVADVQAADFSGNGKLDLVVAAFGWQNTGEVIYLENRTTDWSRPVFVPRVLDDRHGAIHVPVADLNGDGRPDFVALISQEHETVVAFLNEGHGRFRRETIYTAPHPAFGSSGIQLVDLNGDGRLDVLLTNGDVLDEPYLLRPYHGIHWLENRGSFPFVHHQLASMYGVHRAVAADFDGDGDLDIVAVSFLPPETFPQREELALDAMVFLEQTEPGKFVRHVLETRSCDHPTCAAGDWNGDGKIHLVTGNFCLTERYRLANAVTLWKNEEVIRKPPGKKPH